MMRGAPPSYQLESMPWPNMRLQQAALVPVTTTVEAMNTSSKNKITKGGLRQAQARYASFFGDSANIKLTNIE